MTPTPVAADGSRRINSPHPRSMTPDHLNTCIVALRAHNPCRDNTCPHHSPHVATADCESVHPCDRWPGVGEIFCCWDTKATKAKAAPASAAVALSTHLDASRASIPLVPSLPSVPLVPSLSVPTHLTADQAALVDHVKTYHQGVRQSYEHQVQYAFMAGLNLTALKDSCRHGEFIRLRETHLPELSSSAAYRYTEFFTLVNSQFPTVGNLVKDTLLLQNGDLPEHEKRVVLESVYTAADGKSWTAFYRDLNLVRDKQPAAHHPIKPLSPDETIAAENAQSAALVNAAALALQVLLLDLQSQTGHLAIRVPVKLWKEILRTTTQFNKLVRPLSKRKLSPAERKVQITPTAKAALNAAAKARWEDLKAASAKSAPNS